MSELQRENLAESRQELGIQGAATRLRDCGLHHTLQPCGEGYQEPTRLHKKLSSCLSSYLLLVT